jgi:AcrR family transcriptional regulator
MGRNKSVSNEAVLDRLLPLVARLGPAGLTFAAAADSARLAPATLVQRFGTREAMVEAILHRAWDRLDAETRSADAEAPMGAAGAVDLLLRLMPGAALDHAMADGLVLLREDLGNPRLRARGRAWGEALASALGRRLAEGPAEGLRLGWQMARVWQGTLLWWGFIRPEPAEAAIREAMADWCRSVGLDRAP